ncbi:hypothetical protein ACFL0J_08090 [Candidatus Neomarinimicrobiota bacterium]
MLDYKTSQNSEHSQLGLTYSKADPANLSIAEQAEKEKLIPYKTWLIEPVDVVIFLRDYLGINTLSKAQSKVLRETFGKTPGKPFFAIEQMILKVGQGGGKNFTVTPLVIYAIYLWCCLTDPHRYFNMYNTEPFDILNYSQVNAMQARNVFFKTLATNMKQTRDPLTKKNWFVENVGMKIAEYGQKDIREESMKIPHRDPQKGGINIYCLDSEAKSVEGYTIWITIMDEPSRANTPLKFKRAKAQYDTAYTNQKTRHIAGRRLTVVFAYPEQETNDLLVDKERHWGGDFSLVKDSLILVSGYAEKMDREVEEFSYKIYEKNTGKPIDKIVTINSKPVIDLILEWRPRKGMPIDYQNVEDIIIDLLSNSFPNSRSLHFDKWNTESIRQKLLDVGISDCETLAFNNPQQVLYGRVIRHLVWQNGIEYLHNDTLLREMNKLMLLNNSKLDHPDGNNQSKDIWDAVSICVYNIIMRTKMGSNLDISVGDPAMDTKVTEDDYNFAQLYQQAYKLYIKRNGHPPETTEKMRDFLIKDMNYRCTEEDVEYMRELWLDWAYDVNNQVLGHKNFKQAMGLESGNPFAADEELLKDLEAVEDGIIGRF